MKKTEENHDGHLMDFNHLKFKIAVSGAAETGVCAPNAMENTEAIGREIVKHGCVLVTGATTGAPFWAAKGAKEAGGFVVGISPAATKEAHIKSYRLPTDYHDLIIYTGMGYSGRNLIFTRAADAVITVCGRIGTLNEFTDAFEDKKIQGVLLGSGGDTDMIPEILEKAHRGAGRIVYDKDPVVLIEKVVKLLEEEEKSLE
jgi:hypothetical protein